MIEKINLDRAFEGIDAFWSPRIVGALNGQEVKIARVQGEFVWHRHDEQDELFLVLEGRLRLEFRDGALELGPGELCIVPRGTEHLPLARDQARILLFEPAGTLNTGNVRNERTVDHPPSI